MGRKKIISLICSLFLCGTSWGQFTDNFSDGDFSANPPWSGDNSKFTVQAGRLKLQAPAVNDEAFLSTPSLAIHDGSWEFYLQMEFNPSSTNLAKIYLVSDKSVLTSSLKGYFVKAGNTADEVSLYRQDGTTETKIIDGLDGRLNLSAVSMKIKVTRNATGVWQLFSDVGPTGVYSLEGTATDNTHTTSSYAGIVCLYTSTRSDKFWFDDFVVTGIAVPDTTPPALQQVVVSNANHITLVFSEALDRASAETASNYEVEGLGGVSGALLQSELKTVELTMPVNLTNGVRYRLHMKDIKDLAGNEMTTVVAVMYFLAVPSKSKDMILTEIMADPSPQVGLPEVEFVEIFNRSQNPFNILGWKLSDGSSTGTFPSLIILPGEYWVVTANASASLFSMSAKTIGLSNFPTLNNTEETLTLRNAEGVLIDSVHYRLSWYRDVDKQQGGWTLELIDPGNPCGEEDNWTAAESHSGGTPGAQNSVWANKPDLTPPLLSWAVPQSPSGITFSFNEKLDPFSVTNENFSIVPAIGTKKVLLSQDHRVVNVTLQRDLEAKMEYVLTVRNVRDCSGNPMEPVTVMTGLPETPERGDIVLNEILFNPRPGGVDFIEIFNASTKYFNMNNWKLGNMNNGAPSNIKTISISGKLLLPGAYAVWTSDIDVVKWQYPGGREENFFKATLPSLPDNEGSLVIMSGEGNILDDLSYSKSWHSPFVKDEEGVSLERIDASGATHDPSNWTSASSTAGFATPGLVNSQSRAGERNPGDVMIVPEIFSPETGPDEFVQIQYEFEPSDWTANVRVFDQQGHLLKTIAKNETLGTSGFLRWDGDRDDHQKAQRGYYVVWFEIFNSVGQVRTFRKRVVVYSR